MIKFPAYSYIKTKNGNWCIEVRFNHWSLPLDIWYYYGDFGFRILFVNIYFLYNFE